MFCCWCGATSIWCSNPPVSRSSLDSNQRHQHDKNHVNSSTFINTNMLNESHSKNLPGPSKMCQMVPKRCQLCQFTILSGKYAPLFRVLTHIYLFSDCQYFLTSTLNLHMSFNLLKLWYHIWPKWNNISPRVEIRKFPLQFTSIWGSRSCFRSLFFSAESYPTSPFTFQGPRDNGGKDRGLIGPNCQLRNWRSGVPAVEILRLLV